MSMSKSIEQQLNVQGQSNISDWSTLSKRRIKSNFVDRQRWTSWKSIKLQQNPSRLNRHSLDSGKTTLYRIFNKSRQSNEQSSDSLVSSLSLESERFQSRLTTFSQIKFHKYSLFENYTTDRCLQTSIDVNRSISSFNTILPDLKFLKDYANENVQSVSTTENSTSSSGYFSSASCRRSSSSSIVPPLKSCLKRRRTTKSQRYSISRVLSNDIAGDLFTNDRTSIEPFSIELSKRLVAQWTLSENDLRTKKSVSFCDEIVRRLFTPSNSPTPNFTDCDYLPQETLTDSPPNEFEFSDEENVNDDDLIETLSKIILRILEIKCANPQLDILSNIDNDQLDEILRFELCLLLRNVLEDGLRIQSGYIFSRKINLWRLIDVTTSNNRLFHSTKTEIPGSIPSTEKFNAFIYQLLNHQLLASWFNNFISCRKSFENYYESKSLIKRLDDSFFERLTNQLEKLSPLSFHVEYQSKMN